MSRRRLAVVGTILGTIAGGGAAAAIGLAGFSSPTSNTGNTFSAATLAPPTGLTVTANPAVNLAWTATPSTWASGHRVLRALQPGGPYTQIAELTPRTTAAYADSPGAGTFYYKTRGFLAGTTWESVDSNVASRQDSAFVLEGTQAFTTSACTGASGGTGTTGHRDAEQGAPSNGTNLTFSGSSSTGTIAFCTDTFSAGQTMVAGTTTVSAYYHNAAGSGCTVTATLKLNRVGTLTTLGSGSYSVPATSPTTLRAWSFATTAVTFAAGDRLNLTFLYNAAKSCNSTSLNWNSSTTVSKFIVPSIDGYAATVVGTAALVSYWRLGEAAGATTMVDAEALNPGTYLGAPALGAADLLVHDLDTAMGLDGIDDYATVNDSASLSATSAMSAELWLKPDAVNTAAGSGWHLFAKWETFMVYINGGASPKLAYCAYNTSTLSYTPCVQGTTTVATGSTYHVVATYDGANLKLYVNGALEATTPRTGALNDSASSVAVAGGGWGTLPSARFDGTLDELAFYSAALTAAQVQAHYDAR